MCKLSCLPVGDCGLDSEAAPIIKLPRFYISERQDITVCITICVSLCVLLYLFCCSYVREV